MFVQGSTRYLDPSAVDVSVFDGSGERSSENGRSLGGMTAVENGRDALNFVQTSPEEEVEYESLCASHIETFSNALDSAMETLLSTFKEEQRSFKDELLILAGQNHGATNDRSWPGIPDPVKVPPLAVRASSAPAAAEAAAAPLPTPTATSFAGDVEPHSPGSMASGVLPRILKTRPSVHSGYVPLSIWSSGRLHQRPSLDKVGGVASGSWDVSEAPRRRSVPPSKNHHMIAFASPVVSSHSPRMRPTSSTILDQETFQAQISNDSTNHRHCHRYNSVSSGPSDMAPNRTDRNMSLKVACNNIIQKHLQEVYGSMFRRGSLGSSGGKSRHLRRRRSVHSDGFETINQVRGFVRKQKRKAYYQHPESRQKRSFLATMLEVLLRPEDEKDSIDTPLLDLIMSIIVVLNTIVIGVSTDVHRSWSGWVIFDIFFALCYLSEFGLKIKWGGCHRFFCKQDVHLNVFDFALLILAWVEVCFVLTFGNRSRASVLRLFRLVRITKVLRVCRLGMFADLLMMINGAIGSFKTLLYSVGLITIPLYVVSLLFHELLSEHSDEDLGAEEFSSLALTIFNIFRCIIANDCTNQDGKPIFSRVVTNYGWQYGLMYCFTVTFMTFGLFNVIVAIYVENIVTAAKFTARRSKRKRLLNKDYFQDKCLELLRVIFQVAKNNQSTTKHAGGTTSHPEVNITPELLELLFMHEDFSRILHELDIADEDMIDLFETLDVDDNGEVDLEELIVGLAKLRGEFRRSDIIGVSLVCRALQESMMAFDLKLAGIQTRQNMFLQVMQKAGLAPQATNHRSMLKKSPSQSLNLMAPTQSVTVLAMQPESSLNSQGGADAQQIASPPAAQGSQAPQSSQASQAAQISRQVEGPQPTQSQMSARVVLPENSLFISV